MEYHPEEKHKTIDLNYEEISPDRNVGNGNNFANGLQHFRFSVAPGNAIIPSMSYFVIEYNFGSMTGATDAYTATQPLKQSQKITLQNNWPSCLYNSCRYTVAQSEIGVVNSSHAALHTLKQRIGHTTSFMEHIGGDLNAFDPDFSRRLARSCSDGVYHRDGLIDCSPYNSPPLSSDPYTNVPLFSQTEQLLSKNAAGIYAETALYGDTTAATAGNSTFLFATPEGTGNVAWNAAGLTDVKSFLWTLGPNSFVASGNAATDAAIVDANHFNPGDKIVFRGVGATAFDGFECVLFSKKALANETILVMSIPQGTSVAIMNAALGSAVGLKANTGIVSIKSTGGSQYTQPDPRCGVVNGMVVYQAPLSFFEIRDPAVFFGDITIEMGPNSNWAQACIESAVPGKYYNQDVKHGVDYAFGIKAIRLYLARARLLTPPPERAMLMLPDYQISNKQLSSGASTINFNIPPSTNKLVIWIGDSAQGTHTQLGMTRFKTRQYMINGAPGGALANLNRYGPFSKTMDERLESLQVNFAGITKNISNFQRAGQGEISDPYTVSMLQRWVTTNQHNKNRREPEKFTDFLSCGSYYFFNFERSADNNGTYLTINIKYNGDLPSEGTYNSATGLVSTVPSSVNLYVCSIYDREVALTYNQYGNVVSAQTQMR